MAEGVYEGKVNIINVPAGQGKKAKGKEWLELQMQGKEKAQLASMIKWANEGGGPDGLEEE